MKMTKDETEKMNALCERAKALQAQINAFREQISQTIDTLNDEADNAEDVYLEFDAIDGYARTAAGCMDSISDKYTIL